jgi:hypothetical protein
MAQCYTTAVSSACFVPTNTAIVALQILQHITYQNGRPIAVTYTSIDDPTTAIDLAVHLGGGTLDIACPDPASPQELGNAIEAANRNVSPRVETFSGSAQETLGVPAGTLGRIVAIADVATGQVFWTLDGTAPSATNGFTSSGLRSYYGLKNVDLSAVIFDASAGGSRYSVMYEVYL